MTGTELSNALNVVTSDIFAVSEHNWWLASDNRCGLIQQTLQLMRIDFHLFFLGVSKLNWHVKVLTNQELRFCH
jgi:hypothetical protein